MTTTVREELSLERSDKFEGWAVVEVMGHKKFAGFVSEQVIAGAALIRVDVPETQQRKYISGYGGYTAEVKPGYTKLLGVSSIYCITPCNEATARACAQVIEQYNDPLPVTIPKLLAAGTASSEPVDQEVVAEAGEPEYFTCMRCGALTEHEGLCEACNDECDDDD